MDSPLAKLSISLLILIATLSIGEVFISNTLEEPNRAMITYDENLVWTYMPSSSTTFDSKGGHEIEINSAGFRDDEPFKEEDKLRVAVLGDSYTAGVRVPKEERFTERLEEKLSSQGEKARVYNFGVSAYGTDQMLLAYRDIVHEVEPDIVILTLVPNDIRESYSKELFVHKENETRLDSNNKAFEISAKDKALWQLSGRSTLFFQSQPLLGTDYGYPSRLFETTTEGVFLEENKNLGADGVLFRQQPTSEMENATKLWSELVHILNEDVTDDGGELVLASLPIEEQFTEFPYNEELDTRKIDKIANRTARQEEIPLIEILPYMNRSEDSTQYFLEQDYHYSSKGHEIVASAIYNSISDKS